MKTVLIQYIDPSHIETYTFSVAEEFLKICPHYKNCGRYELVNVYKLLTFLHSETRPSIFAYRQGVLYKEYYLFGKHYPNEAAWEKEKARLAYQNKLSTLLDD